MASCGAVRATARWIIAKFGTWVSTKTASTRGGTTIRRSHRQYLPLLLALALAACGGRDKGSSSDHSGGSGSAELTEYQRDSMLSTSTIPGARGVGGAMRAADATSGGIRTSESVDP